MARSKIKIKRIENAATRQVTFSKRRVGLLKKAHDLAVLCDVEVGVIIFSSKGKLFQFASPSMGSVLERYVKSRGHSEAPDNTSSSSPNAGTDRLTQFTEKLKTLQSNLIGDDLERLSLRDLIQLEQQIHDSLGYVHTKKEELLLKQLEDFEEKMMEARKTTNANLSILEKLLKFGPSKLTGFHNAGGQGGSENRCLQEDPQSNGPLSLGADTSELTSEGLPAAKRSIITLDLNKSPARTVE